MHNGPGITGPGLRGYVVKVATAAARSKAQAEITDRPWVRVDAVVIRPGGWL